MVHSPLVFALQVQPGVRAAEGVQREVLRLLPQGTAGAGGGPAEPGSGARGVPGARAEAPRGQGGVGKGGQVRVGGGGRPALHGVPSRRVAVR